MMNVEQGTTNDEVCQAGRIPSFDIQHSLFVIRYFILVIFSVLCSPKITAQDIPDTLSLQQFLDLTEQYTLQQKRAIQDLSIAELNYQLFQARFKPQLSLFGTIPNFRRTFSETVQPNGTIQFQPISNNNSFASLYASQRISKTGAVVFAQSSLQRFDDFDSDFNQYNGSPIRVGIEQPIFAYNQWKWDQQIEPLVREEARKKYAFDLEQAKTLASGFFFNLLLANNNLELAISNENSIQTLFKIAEERYELGKISQRDLLQLEVELASATSNKQAALREVKRISTDILTFLGSENDRLLIPQLPETLENLAIPEEKALQEALLNRFEILSAQIEKLRASSEIERAKRENGIQLLLNASAGYVGSSKDLNPIYTMARNEQAISIEFNVPIVDWGQRRDAIKIANIQQEFTRYKVQQDQLQIRAQVRQILDQFKSLQTEVQLAANIQNLASKRYQISTESYVLGAISLTELTLSQREKDQAKRQYINVLSQYWQMYQLLKMNTLYDFEKGERIDY
ncbi:MAG: TolC family protein [Bacteroidota bacterium]